MRKPKSIKTGDVKLKFNKDLDVNRPKVRKKLAELLKGTIGDMEPKGDIKDVFRNPEKADRYNSGKRKWSLVHWKSIEPLVEVLEFGAKKYSPDNWKKGLDKKEILESMMRHLTALMDGEKTDKESNLRHMGHILCNAMFYNYFDDLEGTEEVK